MKKIFITGICGFVGSELASFYNKKKYHVSGIDNLSRKGSYKNFLKLKKRGIKIFRGDLCNNIFLNKLFGKKYKFSDFIHCAAYTSVLDGTNIITAKKLYENNILSTLNSLELANLFNSSFIYISSSRVYSIDALKSINLKFNKTYKPVNNLRDLTNRGINENFSTEPPLSLYGSSKIICENMIQEYCSIKKIPFIINRCGLLAGKGQLYKSDQGVISFWINSWKKNKVLRYIGFGAHGYQTRDCLHPDDLANLINLQIKKLKKLKSKNRIFNVSGGPKSAFSLKELSDWCCKNISIKKIKGTKKGRVFDSKWIVLDNSKARKEFKWKLKYNKNLIFENILNKND